MDRIEIFKTDLISSEDALELKKLILELDNAATISFDLDDCDKIMRIKGSEVSNQKIIKVASNAGVSCEELSD